MRDRSAFIFSASIALVGVWALLQTWGWPIKAWLYPRFVLVPLLVLALAESVAAFRGGVSLRSVEYGVGAGLGQKAGGETPMDFAPDATVDPALALRRTLLVVAWILGLFLGVILIGFEVAVPLFVFAYLRSAREGWVLSIALAGAAVLAFHGLFVTLLHLPLPEGLLLSLLGR